MTTTQTPLTDPAFDDAQPSDYGAGAVPARLLAGPHTSRREWLYPDRDQALADEIRELTTSFGRLAADSAFSTWTAAAVGGPLLRAMLLDVARQLHLASAGSELTTRQLWDLVEEPLSRYFDVDDVAAGGRAVQGCLDLFALVGGYGSGHTERPGAPAATWVLDREAVWTLVEDARGALSGFATGVAEGKNTEAEIAEHFASLRD